MLLHGALVAGLVAAALISARRTPPSLQPLPIDAVVVDSQVLHAAQRAQNERAEQAARARAAAEAQAAAEHAKAAEQAKEAEQAEQAKEAEKIIAAEKAKDEAQRQQAENQRRADASALAAAAAEARAAAEKERRAQLAADEKRAADAKKAADERARQDREAELRKQLADEEHRSAVESGPLRDSYIARLRNRIQNAWIKPPSASVGLDCLVEVTQIPGGEVTSARVTQCNGDAAARQSIENAVYRASPLPDPPDPALFERNFVFRFKPNE
jgi:colicin import membrane protein